MLDEQAEVIVTGLILESPSLYLDEVCRKIHDLTSLVVSPSCICRLFKRYGVIRKLGELLCRDVIPSEDHSWVNVFCLLDISLCGSIRLAQMPETIICANVAMHLEGLGLCHTARLQENNGLMPLHACHHLEFWQLKVFKELSMVKNFTTFSMKLVIPQMMPFNGSNNNCSIHHTHEMKDLLNQTGVLVLSSTQTRS